jgi:hypothetical protein
LALKQFEIYKSKIKLLKTIINELGTGIQKFQEITDNLKKKDPELFKELKANEILEAIMEKIKQINLK